MGVTIEAVHAHWANDAASTLRTQRIKILVGAAKVRRVRAELVWQGPCANDTLPRLDSELRRLGAAAVELADLAAACDAHADWIHAERARLRRLESHVRQFVDHNPQHPMAIELTSQVFPPPYNTRWAALARRIGGVVHPLEPLRGGVR